MKQGRVKTSTDFIFTHSFIVSYHQTSQSKQHNIQYKAVTPQESAGNDVHWLWHAHTTQLVIFRTQRQLVPNKLHLQVSPRQHLAKRLRLLATHGIVLNIHMGTFKSISLKAKAKHIWVNERLSKNPKPEWCTIRNLQHFPPAKSYISLIFVWLDFTN